MINMRQSRIYDAIPLQASLENSERWMIQCATLVDGVSFSSTNRARVAITLHNLCIEHHTGIHTLTDNGVIGSALALFRPQFEAFIRGAWYHHCAEEQVIEKFIQGAEPPRMGVMIQQLGTKEAFDNGVLTRLKQQHWRNWNDFTHGGAIHVKARNSQDEIIPNYKPEHVASVLTSSATLSLLAGVDIASVAKREDLAVKLREEFRSVYKTFD